MIPIYWSILVLYSVVVLVVSMVVIMFLNDRKKIKKVAVVASIICFMMYGLLMVCNKMPNNILGAMLLDLWHPKNFATNWYIIMIGTDELLYNFKAVIRGYVETVWVFDKLLICDKDWLSGTSVLSDKGFYEISGKRTRFGSVWQYIVATYPWWWRIMLLRYTLAFVLHLYGWFDLQVDSLSLVFLFLIAFIIPLVILLTNSIVYYYKLFIQLLLIMYLLLIVAFSCTDLLMFYVCFELILIPMFLIILIWGVRTRKIHAAYMFFFYSLVGSFCMLSVVLYCYSVYGTVSVEVLQSVYIPLDEQKWLWLLLFCAFAVKMPLFPFHIWLPEAHVEAPTIGSVILAAILLKLGSYGYLRFVMTWLPEGHIYNTPFATMFCMLGIIYATIATIRQIDLKKVIAYASVSHMSYVMLGLMSTTKVGVSGAVFLMIGHGLVSAGLFICVGVLYDRYHTRIIKYYGGLATTMPLFSIFFLLLTLANMSFPGTINFSGEVLILSGTFDFTRLGCLIATVMIFGGTVYSIWLYNRLCFGDLKENFGSYADLSFEETIVLAVIVIWVIIGGIASTSILSVFSVTIDSLLFVYVF